MSQKCHQKRTSAKGKPDLGFVLGFVASFIRRSLSALRAVRTARDLRLNLISSDFPSQTIQPFATLMIVYIALIPKI